MLNECFVMYVRKIIRFILKICYLEFKHNAHELCESQIFGRYLYRVHKVKTHRDFDLKKNLISHNMLIAKLQ